MGVCQIGCEGLFNILAKSSGGQTFTMLAPCWPPGCWPWPIWVHPLRLAPGPGAIRPRPTLNWKAVHLRIVTFSKGQGESPKVGAARRRDNSF